MMINKDADENKCNCDRYPPDVELAFAPNAGVELVCCPKTGVGLGLGLAPKAGGVWEGGAVKGDPKDEPKEGA